MPDTKYIPPHLRNSSKLINIQPITPLLEHLKKRRRICCGGILLYHDINSIDNKIYVIIVHGRSSFKWGLPKGGLEFNESHVECAMREIKEETGLMINLNTNHKRVRIHSTYYYIIKLSSKYTNMDPIDKQEIVDIKWIDINDIEKYKVNRELRDFSQKKDYILKIMNDYDKRDINIY